MSPTTTTPASKPTEKAGQKPALRKAPEPHVPRLARAYKAVDQRAVDYLQYPAVGAPSILASLHDIGHIQGLLASI